MRIITIFMSITLTLLLSNCVSYDLSRRVVQQGNLLQPEKIEKIKVGMSKNDIAILMGNSLINPMFTENRWDYAYTLRKGSDRMLVRKLSVYFNHGKVVRIER